MYKFNGGTNILGQKKNYSRSFIILQENEKGHGISADKLPTGYAKIETRNGKCKVFFYVQNLKGTSKPYYMVLVCNKKDTKKLIKLGELKLDEYGKAEISREYSENDVGESGIGIDRVIGVAISQFNGSDMLVLMSGFNATDIPEDWRTYSFAATKTKEVNSNTEKTVEVKKVETKKVETKKVEAKPVEAKKTEVKPVEAKKVEVKPVEAKTTEIKEKEVKAEVVKTKTEDRKIEEEVKDEEKQPDKKESVNIFDKYEESIENTKKDNCDECKNIEVNETKDEKREENNEVKIEKEENKCPCCSYGEQNDFESETHMEENRNEDYPIGRTGEFFKGLADELEDLGETFPDVRCCRWYKVSTDFRKHKHHKENHNKYTLLYYPMMPYYAYIQKSGCYLVGYKYDPKGKMKYIVYGILGTKNKCDQPFGGRTGFVSWVPMEKGKEGYDDKGCWLMFYDFKNATILVPRR